MSDTPAIRLKRGEGRAFKAGGPWIYDNEIAEILGEPADGGIVRIEDYNGYSLGVGFPTGPPPSRCASCPGMPGPSSTGIFWSGGCAPPGSTARTRWTPPPAG